MRLGLLLAAALLAGCASLDGGFALGADGLANDMATQRGTEECGTTAVLRTTLHGTAGRVEATVVDGAGNRVADRIGFAGDHEGEIDLQGAAGTWFVELRHIGFTGEYQFYLQC